MEEKDAVNEALFRMGIDSITGKGEIKNKHMYQIISYLFQTKSEEYDKSLAKLAVSIQMDRRKIRENYMEGLEAWDIILVKSVDRKRIWFWNIKSDEEKMNEELKEKEKRGWEATPEQIKELDKKFYEKHEPLNRYYLEKPEVKEK